MSKKLLFGLGCCLFVGHTGIAVVFEAMPLYLVALGADARAAGTILAAAYTAMAASTVAGGFLSSRLQRRTAVLLVGGAAAAPIAWLLGRVTSVGALLIAAAGLWFATGLAETMTKILAGLLAQPAKRGQVFGRLSLASGLGLSFGSLVTGPIVDHWGFTALFSLLSALELAIVGAGWWLRDPPPAEQPASPTARFGNVLKHRAFRLLFLANIVGQATSVMIALSRPLIMLEQGFSATAITTAAAIGSVASLPLALLDGRLSDSIGRKPLIVLCFLTTPLGLVMLSVAVQPWHFWVAALLQSSLGVSLVSSQALVADLFAPEARDTALALLNATIWMGLVVGLSGASLAISAVGMLSALAVSGLISLVAILLLVALPGPARAHQEPT